MKEKYDIDKLLGPVGEDGYRGVAYSYVRFSTARQELGDSLRRQVEMAEEYAQKHKLKLSERSFRDLGVSGFRGKNTQEGAALRAFITAVESGAVEKGSYLLIEQFDRLGRDQVMRSMRLLADLVYSGIIVVTLADEMVWNAETVEDMSNVLTSVIIMGRAYDESKSKSDRLRKVWGKKKAQTIQGLAVRIVTSECPRWLVPTEDKTGFVVLDDKVESVKRVFQMRIAGHGISHIVSTANAEHWPAPGKQPVQQADESDEDFDKRKHLNTWHTSLVGRLLKNRALLGEYQPHINDPDPKRPHNRIPVGEPIKDYYPAVLDEETFLRAQAVTDRRGRFPGRRDPALKNWLQGLLRCNCGHTFVRKNKDSKAQPDYARYYCTARIRAVKGPGQVLCPGANAKELETAVLHVISFVAPAFFDGSSRIEELKTKIDLLSLDMSAAKTTRDRFLDAIGDASSKTPPRALAERLDKAETEIERIERELARARAELADMGTDMESVFENIVKQVKSVDSLDARAKLREELSRVIEKVVVHENDGYIEVHLRGGDMPIVQPLRPNAALPGLAPVL